MTRTSPSPSSPIVAIGGVGGSGTRLIAQIVAHLGWDLGGDLNQATDNLWFTLLFKRVELWRSAATDAEFRRATDTFRAVMSARPLGPGAEMWLRGLVADRPHHDRPWLLERVESLLAASARVIQPRPWGWKEPNTHVFLDRLAVAYPDMSYVHVVRNGLDMAHSPNQQQLALWGPLLFGLPAEQGPRAALRFWCAVQRRIDRIGQDLSGRLLVLNYDDLCRAPDRQLTALTDFLGLPASRAADPSLRSLVRVPDSIGRFKRHGLGMFDPADVEFVRAQGFDVEIEHQEAVS